MRSIIDAITARRATSPWEGWATDFMFCALSRLMTVFASSAFVKPMLERRITIRLSPEVVARFRATGKGWQSRMNAALQDWLRKHKSAA
ncbi:MAG: hypothetical protein EBW73_01425 [Betaproteobacteria bacterium]|nr:hypothetical protein [Betaproteobacteria bacterium]